MRGWLRDTAGGLPATYWYLWAAPELMAMAAERLETTLGELP